MISYTDNDTDYTRAFRALRKAGWNGTLTPCMRFGALMLDAGNIVIVIERDLTSQAEVDAAIEAYRRAYLDADDEVTSTFEVIA